MSKNTSDMESKPTQWRIVEITIGAWQCKHTPTLYQRETDAWPRLQ